MIFINYRKSDTQAVADHLAENLREAFGDAAVFQDQNDLFPGKPWPDGLRKALLECKVLRVLIGTTWLSARDEDGRLRIEDLGDWVRREICTALKEKKLCC